IAEVVLYEVAELRPGATAFAQLRTDDPLLMLPGDRAILRQFSPVVTIGGAAVLDAFPLARQTAAERLPFLKIQAQGNPEQSLLARIARRGRAGLGFAAAVRETGLKPSVLQPIVAALTAQKQVLRAGDFLVTTQAFNEARQAAAAALDAFHKANPLVG